MTFGYDFYHLNFSDGDIPLAELQKDDVEFVVLKYTQGISYETGASWARSQEPRLRAIGLNVGGYHMLDGRVSAGSGFDQADYFLSKYTPHERDLVPCVDFEESGFQPRDPRTHALLGPCVDLAGYKTRAIDFIRRVHGAGFEAMIYGHSLVKAAWSDWRTPGADYWWVPGDIPHDDVGPVGPDLWQFSPYNPHVGWPGNFAGRLLDCSKVITKLPRIGGGDDTVSALDDYRAGVDAAQTKAADVSFQDIGSPPGSHTADWNAGWKDVRWQVNKLRGRDGVDGIDGEDGIDGADAVIVPGTVVKVVSVP